MKYFISTDKAYLDAINTRPFVGGGRTTTKLVQIAKHPLQDKWAAVIPDPHVNSIGSRLTPEEAAQIIPALVDFLSEDWFVVIGSDPELGDEKGLVYVD